MERETPSRPIRPAMPMPTTVLRRSLARVMIAGALIFGAALPAHGVLEAAPRDGFAGSSRSAARTPPGGATHGRVGPTISGLDVSHWQGAVDWSRVADAGKRFVFLKATDDDDYVDPTFATNRAGARANGLSVGAYHFARPDPSPGDARQEARFFVRVANPRPGDLLPVLDMETSQGLNQDGVTSWARTWVGTVRELTGVTPLVYTSPYGWSSRTGDTPLLARDGAPLWVAHWGVSAPTLPADDWGGRGWVVWQHTSEGHVPGIAGDVDLDRLAGTRLGRITLRRLSIAVEGGAGRVTSTPGGAGCAAICAHSMYPDAIVTLTAVPDDQAYFTGWTGACAGTARTCTVTMRGDRTVGARFVTDISPPVANIAAPANLGAPVVVEFDEDVRGVTRSNVLLRANGGAKVPVARVCRSRSGARTACDATNVRAVSLAPLTPLVPGRVYVGEVNPAGEAPLVRDRVGNSTPITRVPFEAARAVEQTSGAVTAQPGAAWTTVHVADERFEDLTDGAHVLRVFVTGRRSSGSAGALVAVDRFDVLG